MVCRVHAAMKAKFTPSISTKRLGVINYADVIMVALCWLALVLKKFKCAGHKFVWKLK